VTERIAGVLNVFEPFWDARRQECVATKLFIQFASK